MRWGKIAVLLFSCIYGTTLWAQSSPLASGKWSKIATSKQGVYQVTGTQLQQFGVSLPVSSANLKMLGFDLNQLQEKVTASPSVGLTEISIDIKDGGDGQFDASDYLLFYAPGPVHWSWDSAAQKWNHSNKTVNDSVYYFIGVSSGTKRITTVNYTANSPSEVSQFDANWLIEKDSINLLNSGKQWLGAPMGVGSGKTSTINYTLNMAGLQLNQPVSFYTRHVATSYQDQGAFSIAINGTNTRNITVPSVSGMIYDATAKEVVDSFTLLSPLVNFGSNLASVTIGNSFSGTNTSVGWLDFMEIEGKASIDFLDKKNFSFTTKFDGNLGGDKLYKIQNADATTFVWEVTNPLAPVNLQASVQSNVLKFSITQNGVKEFFTVKQNAFEKPDFVEQVDPQALLTMLPPDYLIIAAPAYLNAAKKLQAFHVAKEGYNSMVINSKTIFNEFSGGQASPIAIRNFLQLLQSKANVGGSKQPAFLVLMGMGNFNPKKLNVNYELPVYESEASNDILKTFTSDDFFALLNPSDDINAPENITQLSLNVGRLPVRNIAEADSVVAKLIQYQSEKYKSDWQNKITFVADDGDYNLHLQDAETISGNIKNKTNFWNIKKIYLDLFPAVAGPTGNTYPSVVNTINEAVNTGTLLLNYTGHGNYLRLTEEAVIAQVEMQKWNNENRLPLMVTASCDFAPFDQPQLSPIGFQSLMQNRKGIAGLVAASRLVFAYSNEQINDQFLQQLLVANNGTYPTVGLALRKAKEINWAQNGDRVNAFKFNLMGDPAMRLSQFNFQIAIDSINQKSFTGKDTIETGKGVQLKGKITAGQKWVKSFNGFVDFTVFDAVKEKATLGNQSASIVTKIATQESILFKGKAAVNNGVFSVNFIIPKEVGTTAPLRIQYYAYQDSLDAFGMNDSLFVKNSLTANKVDSIGPSIKVYINDTSFMNGAWVNANATLLVSLKDSSGIQTSGNSLGHDVRLIIDGDLQHPIVLNNYFAADLNSFTSGWINYSLPVFSPGKHSLQIKAWDLMANSTSDTIYFEVPTTNQWKAKNFINMPNPMQSFTRFSVELNALDPTVQASLQIFDLAGNNIFTSKLDPSLYQNKIIFDWNGKNTAGGQLPPGVYFAQMQLIKGKESLVLSSKLYKL